MLKNIDEIILKEEKDMKKIVTGSMLVLSMILLNGCGGGGSSDGAGSPGGGGQQPASIEYEYIEISNLWDGYEIEGVNSRNENITLLYCSDGHYEYYRNNEKFTGSYNVVDDEIQMMDDNGGSYVLETGNALLEVDEIYPCDSLGRDLQVDKILASDC
jgi:hypothetical protein